MYIKMIILFCAISAALAYEYEPVEYLVATKPLEGVQEQYVAYPNEQAERVKRQVQLQGGGGGSNGKGYDVSIDGRAPVWTSDNNRHSIDATAGYSQHLGGPYGNSRPDVRGGAVYTFRW